jgi:hypothetical protein
MKQNYIFRLAAALVIGIAVTWIAYIIIIDADKKFFNSIRKNEFIFRDDTTRYDILLLGSSRMKNTVNPRIIDSITGLNSYNAGASGAHISEIKSILDAYLLQHRPPSYIILALDYFALEVHHAVAYYPTYITVNHLEPIDKMLRSEGVHTGMYKIFPFLRLTALDDYYKSIVLQTIRNRDDIADDDFLYKGYVSNTAVTIPRDSLGPAQTIDVQDKGKKILNDLIALCREKNIRLVLTYAPEFRRNNIENISNADSILNHYAQVAMQNNLPFYRHDLLPMCDSPAYFVNNGHVNRIGADVYSYYLAQQIINDSIIKPGAAQQ